MNKEGVGALLILFCCPLFKGASCIFAYKDLFFFNFVLPLQVLPVRLSAICKGSSF